MADGTATQSTAGTATAITTSTPSHNINPTPSSTSSHPPSAAVEMSVLDAAPRTSGAGGASASGGLLNDVSIPQSSPIDTSFSDMAATNTHPVEATSNNSAAPVTSEGIIASEPLSSTSPPQITRLDSVAIGPSTDAAPVVATEAGPVLVITLLLPTGARHPYKIDERYLTKRSVNVPGVTEGGRKDPYSISVYTLKELILREWREEWEAQPSSPSSIRLIYFGRLLDDKTPLKDCRFNEKEANVVHMTVRPQDIVDEEDASKGKGIRDRDGNESTAGCRCVIL
ncbi:hypothetical protein LSUE1_G009392 [Lachnellula suecica]|uniref:Ubiquitin-like domain-containing protein n=1 Tax=Lachnellula suecica TaxID=602035 RepID=A0A8T9BUY7_9HELO|nr:hypothetical protein LSUE1_G009392 [Lachnellula suecica]